MKKTITVLLTLLTILLMVGCSKEKQQQFVYAIAMSIDSSGVPLSISRIDSDIVISINGVKQPLNIDSVFGSSSPGLYYTYYVEDKLLVKSGDNVHLESKFYPLYMQVSNTPTISPNNIASCNCNSISYPVQ